MDVRKYPVEEGEQPGGQLPGRHVDQRRQQNGRGIPEIS
jgi:hypothetical protein